jgi:protoporphyrinogen/coproporphyrinogen III oxidase
VTRRVAIVGAGVAGLAVADRLLRSDPDLDVTVLEASDRVGGRLRSVWVGGLELEAGPDAFVARKPAAIALCEDLGLELIAPRASGAAIWTELGLVELPPTALGVPAAIDDLARWPGLSRSGRLRALRDLVTRPHPGLGGDEPLGAALRRRLGDEATDSLVAPLLAGLFAGDVDRLGVRATFPELVAWERTFGSLIRGARAALKAGRDAAPIFLKPIGGVAELPSALADRIGRDRVVLGSHVEEVTSAGERFVVRTGHGSLDVDAVVLATPAFAAAEALEGGWPAAADALRAIRYVSTGVVLLVYPDGVGDHLPEASGFVVPRDRAPMTAATFVSRKWPDPAYGSRAVLRCFVGADGSEDVLDAADDEIVEAVSRHLAALLDVPEAAEAAAVVRWPRAMPQYEVGHLERVAAIERSLSAGVFVTGNAYRGVGVADTVRAATDVADLVLAHVSGDLGQTDRTERVR